ncbi:MAG: TatD family hydrolase [Clostridiales bacterium]|nr:TatD family hydrolase [Clostridiales bacterium]
MIFDTHAHYDDKQFDPDRDALLGSMHERNVGNIVNVGAALVGCYDSVALAEKYDFIYAAVGVHPDEVGDINGEFLAWMEQTARTNLKVVAIGEIGLDYHWDVQSHEVQAEWFIRQMDMARELGLPIMVHSREAAQDTFDIIKGHGRDLGGIIHCYSYSPEMAVEYVKLGYHIGLGGVVTFKNSKKAKETARNIPLESIVLETDCPYMAPVPFRGKRNSSDLIKYVAEEIAAIKGIPVETVIEQTEINAKELLHVQ